MKAIETEYKGYRFRSRLEARWAVFMDALNVKWDYEPEGYELPSGWYLPDFFVHFRPDDNSRIKWPNAGFFLEIKPVAPSERERNLATELAKFTMHNCVIATGVPGSDYWWCASRMTPCRRDMEYMAIHHDSEEARLLDLEIYFGRASEFGDGIFLADPYERFAINAARAARFER